LGEAIRNGHRDDLGRTSATCGTIEVDYVMVSAHGPGQHGKSISVPAYETHRLGFRIENQIVISIACLGDQLAMTIDILGVNNEPKYPIFTRRN